MHQIGVGRRTRCQELFFCVILVTCVVPDEDESEPVKPMDTLGIGGRDHTYAGIERTRLSPLVG